MTTLVMQKRPFLLYLLPILFLLAAAISLVAALGVFQSWNWWLAFTSLTPIIFNLFAQILSAMAWISAAVILWLRLSWAVPYCTVVTILLTVWQWIDRLFLTNNPLPFSRHLLTLAITCLFLLIVFSSLYLVAPFMKSVSSIQSTGKKNE